jgi:succinate dehydrogenase / fumarate reductase, membrane anchor subunit
VTTVPAPRTRRYAQTERRGPNLEMWSWLFMRISGVVLLVLVFGHLFTNLWLGDGVKSIDFGFVAGKWANPVWQVWDLAMLWLAMIHGTNGVRTIINDYAERDGVRFWLKIVLYAASVLTVILGTLVIFTFDPCPPNSPASLLPSFCQG